MTALKYEQSNNTSSTGSRKPTIEELNYKIAHLEARIDTLERRAQKRTGVVLGGSNETAKSFYKMKMKEIEHEKGGE